MSGGTVDKNRIEKARALREEAQRLEDEAESELTRLFATPIDIKDGTTILVSGCISYETLDELSRQLRLKGLRDVMVICIRPGQTIETLDDVDMERFGWVRKVD